MTREAMMKAVEGAMPLKRWKHTLGVMETAVTLAQRFGGDPHKADLAALLHDYAKYWPTDRMEAVIREQGLPHELLEFDKELWHAPVGAYAVQRDFGIEDEEVLDAIRYHTSGRADMTLLDRIVCLADYMEPGRDFPGVDRIRELAEENLNLALVAGFDSTIGLLVSKNKRILPSTVEARNSLITEVRTSKEE
ncbi:phosphohydrolase [Paenibacillus swuensis]|uniref:bis(5'-nucleosyl)-tetraphosphatase (symmetrical) n=1 Tax=Paenibacillus swuensis TaxID=1178515 RepID=A0A172TPM4_9BACL|nr:phosphohydrolase [Paenibacillus swuensis]